MTHLVNLPDSPMDLHSTSTFTYLTILLLLSYFLLNLRPSKNKPKTFNDHLPPSPPKLPLIGHLHHLIGEPPHHAFRRLALKYGPIMQLQLGETPLVVISSPYATKQALKIQDPACADRPQSIGTKIMWYDYTDLAFSPYNEYWRQMRKICILEMLSAKNVKSFMSIREDEISRLVDTLKSAVGQTVNLTEMVFALSSSVTSRAAFGKVMRERDVLIGMMRKAVTVSGGFELADLYPSSRLLNLLCWNKHKLLRMRRRMDAILDAVVEEHRLKQTGSGEYGGEDIVDVLLRMQRNGELEFPITNHNIKAIIFDMFSAGTETSSTLTDWTMAELIRNPEVLSKAQTEIRQACNETIGEKELQRLKYLKLVIKETLRLHPPIPLLPRACRDECTINGYSIPLKSKVAVNIWSLGRDPECWDEPEAFRPERFEESKIDFMGNNFEYIPFGAGKRICPGMNFGLASVELTLAKLLYHFEWQLPEGMNASDIDMTEEEGIAVSRKKGLLLIPNLYNPPS